MTNKELEAYLKKLEAKIDRSSDIEMKLESSWSSIEKFRNTMIEKGYSYEMIEEFNKAINPIQQQVNTIRNLKRKAAFAEEELKNRQKAEKTIKNERVKALISRINLTPEFPYNTKCSNFSFIDGEPLCEVKMPLLYCGNNCPYCTNMSGSYKTDKRGNVTGIRKSYERRGTK